MDFIYLYQSLSRAGGPSKPEPFHGWLGSFGVLQSHLEAP